MESILGYCIYCKFIAKWFVLLYNLIIIRTCIQLQALGQGGRGFKPGRIPVVIQTNQSITSIGTWRSRVEPSLQ